MILRLVILAVLLIGGALVVALQQAQARWGDAPPGVRVAFYPPVWDGVQVFRAIVIGGARPIAALPMPGAWIVHVDPDQSQSLPWAVSFDPGPFTGWVSAACITTRNS